MASARPQQNLPAQGPVVQHQSSTHMMKTTKSGRPFAKDIHDLFSTLAVSLPLDIHRHLFRSYPNTFTTEEAVANLGSLKFTQSHRTPDPKDPSRIITTTTTTTFSMTKDMAKSVCQTLMDAKLFENAADPSSRTFRDKNLWSLTPKGLFVLEQFVTRNGITSPNLVRLFAAQTHPIKLYYLGRSDTDSLILNRSSVESIFQRFAGQQPNDITNKEKDSENKGATSDSSSSSSGEKYDRDLGIELRDRQQNHKIYRNTFTGVAALDRIVDFTTALARDEASKVANEFLRCKWIESLPDKKSEKQEHLHNVQELRISRSGVYTFTEEGRRIAGWEPYVVHEQYQKTGLKGMLSYANLKDSVNKKMMINGNGNADRPSSIDSNTTGASNGGDTSKHHRSMSRNDNVDGHVSSTKKLQQILEDSTLRSLFMDFLKANFCEENLLFLLDVQDFKARHGGNVNKNGEPKDATEQKQLITDAFRIHNDFLASGSPHELNIDHALRQQMIQYMATMNEQDGESATTEGSLSPQITIGLYDKIQDTIFRLVASDSVPKFIKTEKYLSAQGRRSGDTCSNLSSLAEEVVVSAPSGSSIQQKKKGESDNHNNLSAPSSKPSSIRSLTPPPSQHRSPEESSTHAPTPNGVTIPKRTSHDSTTAVNNSPPPPAIPLSTKPRPAMVAQIIKPATNGIVPVGVIEGEAL